MSASYIAVRFDTTDLDPEIAMAMLSAWPFDSFYEEANAVTGYLPVADWNEPLQLFLAENKGAWFVDYAAVPVEDQNWNAVWESSFQPVVINNYCYIRAAFHAPAPAGVTHEVIIAPKMAFGTGHHATTYMMIEAMEVLDWKNKRVLDFGCGTGILSVVAAKEGADEVIGIDIQPEAIENSVEHATLNGVETACKFILGGFENAGAQPYDMILANINTKIILEYFDELKALVLPGGYILLSGIMTADMSSIDQHLNITGLRKINDNRRDEWVQVTFTKKF